MRPLRSFRKPSILKPSDQTFLQPGSDPGEEGDHEEAIREYREALRLSPSNFHSHYNLGNLLSKMGHGDEAIVAYQQAIEADPERPEAHFNLAGSYWEEGRWPEAAVHYEEALAGEIGPQQAAGAHLRLGANFTNTKEWNKAEKHLLAAVESTARQLHGHLLPRPRLPEHRLW